VSPDNYQANIGSEDDASLADDDQYDDYPASGWTFPADIDRWLIWTGIALTCLAAWQTATYFVGSVFFAWGYTGEAIPRPNGYYSLLLLAGVLLLVWQRDDGTLKGTRLRSLSCLAACTGGALVAAQATGSADLVFHFSKYSQSLTTYSTNGTATVGEEVFYALESLGDTVPSIIAVIFAALLYRSQRYGQGQPLDDDAGTE